MQAKISILFYAKRAKATTNGLIPIYLRVTINGHRIEISTKRYCLIAGFVSIILLYVIVNNLIEFMQKEHEEILTGLDVIKNHHLVYDTLEKLYIRPYKANTRVGKEEFFEFDGKSYALIFDYSKRLLRPDDFLMYLTKLNKQGRYLFLITDKKIDARDFSKLHNFEHLCTIISYENYTDLKSHLNDKLVRKLMKEQSHF